MKKQNNYQVYFRLLYIASLAIFFAVISSSKVFAANEYFSPSFGNYNVGDTVRLSVLVDTQNTPINTVESSISYSDDVLDISSVSKSNSILTFWTQEPTFSNANGLIYLSGGLPTPGYNGSNGKIVDIYFKVKKSGTASFSITAGSVRANDGLGTDVLQTRGKASFTLKGKVVTPAITTPKVVSLPTEIVIKEIMRADLTNPQARFAISAKNPKEDLSGIDHYSFQIAENTPELWNDDGTHIYTTRIFDPNTYNIIVKAFDVKGNFVSASGTFTIDALKTPTITDYSKSIFVSDNITVKGNTYKSGQVTVFVQKDSETPKSIEVQANQNGEFFYVSDPQTFIGKYSVWVQAFDNRGAKSLPSEKLAVEINKSQLAQYADASTNILLIVLPAVVLLSLLVLVTMYVWHKLLVLKKRIRKETRAFEKDIHKAFDLLRDDMAEQIKMLKKAKSERSLTAEEEKIVKKLKNNLDTAENFIQKEIETVEKEVQ